MFDNLLHLEKLAQKALDKDIFDHIVGGSGEETSVKANYKAYSKFFLIPRVLVDVSNVDISTNILSRKLSNPIIIAPTAFHGLVNKNKEIATSLAAETTESLMIVSMMSNSTLEEIADSTKEPLWFQLHIHKERDVTKQLIYRAEKAGYEAIVITVDIPQRGIRYRDLKNKFKLPNNCYPGNFLISKKDENVEIDSSGVEFNPSATWDDIKWIKSITKLPILLKGILHQEDALKAIDLGVSGIIISNHGGRQLDGAASPISVLCAIANIVKRRIPILIDGGVRSGSDVVKAISLGANAVLIGRPIMWGLALSGQQGVVEVIEFLKRDLKLTMQHMGCQKLSDLNKKDISIQQDGTYQELAFENNNSQEKRIGFLAKL